MTIHVYFCFPETSGKTLEEVEDLFAEGVPAWKTKVEFRKIRAAERGDVSDKEKALHLGRESPVQHKTIAADEAKPQASKN